MAKWDYLFADEAPPVDKGPAARRAAAGRPPEAGMTDPNPSEPQLDVSKRTIGGQIPGVTRGGLPLPPPTPEGEASGVPDPTKYRVGEGARAPTELEGDPMAQSIVASALTAPLAAGGLSVASKFGPAARAAATPVVGAAQGGTTSKMQGQDFTSGAVAGGVLALAPALESVGTLMSQKGRDIGIVQDLAPYAPAEARQQMRRIGYAKVAETARKYGVVGAKDPQIANDAVKTGKTAIGQQIGDTYSTIGNEYARPTTGLMQAVEREAQSMRGTRAGNEIADALFDEAKRIHDLHGDTGTIPLRDIRRELTDSQSKGYSGAKFEKLSDASKEKVQRALARHLQAELDAGLSLAGKDPRYASMVERIPELNATYRSLEVLDETTGRMVDRAMTRRTPTAGERAKAMLPGNRLPVAAQPVAMPSGTRVGTLGTGSSTAPYDQVRIALQPGLANALARRDKDPDAVAVELANELFGRPSD